MTNDTDRKVAEILGWLYFRGQKSNDGLGPYFDSHWRRGEEARDNCPAYTTDPALIGEMLIFLNENAADWGMSPYKSDGTNFIQVSFLDETGTSQLRFTDMNLSLAHAVIAIGGE